ncbi:hypothetical protein [Lactococcus lactis]|jgi:hypothetical protein|uniref:hypothetical protein n=1 Tax=Lactococcus lactis TaxID=1358 RepID=UPI001913D259|nr:hypothetical protein [Lactococcus lactis]MCT0449977.1 hypothetical protein [Lactococcus lactis subsp. lactis]MDR0289104.1 hypothetical protein [Rickettsiales bacterium]WDA67518.1 hypothetical protein IL310_01175 [Lactococcus lactis]WDA67523.1 hypothetical protein IL310_01200 [Lactococcus lactis]
MEKTPKLRPFAPNGLLSDSQTKQIVAWWNGEKRVVTTREISKIVKVSRGKLTDIFQPDNERPLDDLKLGAVNRLIALYNQDIVEAQKQEKQNKAKDKIVEALATDKERAQKLIDKVNQ